MGKVYVMVTHWDNHWENTDRTHYTKDYIHFSPDEISEDIPTFFIKINRKTNEIEHIYKGSISNIQKRGDEVWFDCEYKSMVSEDFLKNLGIPYKRKSGWYMVSLKDHIEDDEDLCPPFFEKLKITKDPNEFEDKVYLLLKLIGIPTIIKYQRKKQAGLPDGIFKIKNLVVIYDVTFKNTDEKKNQILNYVNRLKSDKIEVLKDENWEIRNYTKQVWLISRNESKGKGRKEDNILVKTVSVDSLISLYLKRLKEIDKEEELVESLERIQ